MKLAINTLVITSLFASTAVLANEASSWEGEAELGIVSTSGNTETQSVNGKVLVKNEREKWHHEASLSALQVEDSVQTTAEKYIATGKSEYKIDDIRYIFGTVKYEDDKFSGYEYRAIEAVGYGHRVIKQEDLNLNLEAGVGARQSKPNNGSSDGEGIVLLAGNLGWKISDTSKLTEELTSEIGDDATISKSITGLKTQVNGALAMKVTYTVQHTSKVPASIEKTDRETAVTLVYSF